MTTYSSAQYTPTRRNPELRNPFPSLPVLPPEEGGKLLIRTLHALAWSVAEKRARKDSRAIALRAELAREAESAAGETIALVLTRFANFAPNAHTCLVSRILILHQSGENLTLAMPLPVWRAAHKACDRALRKMAREVAEDAMELRTFDASGWADFANVENEGEMRFAESMACLAIRHKAEVLREAIRTHASSGNGNTQRAARAFLAKVSQWEARAIALVRGDNSAPPLTVISSRAETTREVTESLAIRKGNRHVQHDGKGSTSGTRQRKDKEGFRLYSAGWKQVARLEAFIGQPLATV
ncbi:hypothetical protein OpiT1DRAFT_05633 [Opitutaceae bacterium TAV1]|nr:hypothetical protein OpiT1DRAFT_05633 [Opitutaceae bacterium TAV1]